MSLITATDEELMLAYKGGNQRAFEQLLNRHKRGVYNFLYRFLGQNENVEEAFQEVFVRVIRSADSYHPSAKFTTWLYTIVRNHSIDLSRKGKFRKTESMSSDGVGGDGDEIVWEEKLKDDRSTPDLEVVGADLAQKLDQALSNINTDQREVFLLREKQGLSFEEIASVVGSSVNTVKSRMRYALGALQDEFKKLGITDLK